MNLDFSSSARPRGLLRSGALRTAWPWLAAPGLLAATVLERRLVPANTDVAWLLTAAEKWWGGASLYGEVLETNPPIAVLTYLPAVLLGRALGVPPEAVVDALVLLGVLASLALCVRLLAGTGLVRPGQGAPLLLVAGAVLLLLPARSFGQREHIALLALLPMLALGLRRIAGAPVARWMAVAAGLGAGATLCFKPHFALAVACAPLLTAWQRRDWRGLLAPEGWIAVAVAAVAASLTVLLLPGYLGTVVPLVREVYLQLPRPWTDLLTGGPVTLAAAALVAAWVLPGAARRDAPLQLLMLTSLAFAVAFLVQRKGWAYQAYPMLALALLALAASAIRSAADAAARGRVLAGAGLFAVVFAAAGLIFNASFETGDLEARLRPLAPRPRLLALSGEPGLGHPLVRALHGEWVSRQQALWVHDYAELLRPGASPEARRVLDRHEAQERAGLLDDIRRRPPDLVLVDDLTGQWSAVLASDADLAALLSGYRPAFTLNRVTVLQRPR
jgi:hypothetical protein